MIDVNTPAKEYFTTDELTIIAQSVTKYYYSISNSVGIPTDQNTVISAMAKLNELTKAKRDNNE